MNLTIARALFLDIVHQTLDNRMFRLLTLLVLGLVLPTFLIGFDKDAIDLLFGWKRIPYEDIFKAFHGANLPDTDPSETAIQQLQRIFVQFFAGTLGLLFCIAATAFFLPNVLEKGAAENVFAKPISRGIVLLSRYCAGIFFVAVLSSLLVFGIYSGLSLRSNYNDPGFLFSIVTLVYLFAILHGVSLLIGVFTRNSITASLGTMLFFAFNGCVQNTWKASVVGLEMGTRAENWQAEAEEPEAEEVTGGMGAMLRALNIAHYILPKTMDAGILSDRLRRRLTSQAVYIDELTGVRLKRVPEGFTREPGGHIEEDGLLWSSSAEAGPCSLRLRRFERRVERPGSKRPRYLFPSAASDVRAEELARLGVQPEAYEVPLAGGGNAASLAWLEQQNGEQVQLEAHYFTGNPDWLFVLETSQPAPAGLSPTDAENSLARQVLDQVAPAELLPADLYAKRLAWSGPLQYNLWFSIGSTLAFVLLMLGVAWWKLARMDF